MTKVRVVVSLVLITVASAVFGREAQILGRQVVCREPGRYLGWPTLCRRANGEMLVVFSGDRDAHVCPWGKVQLVRSTDDGRTWSAPETVCNAQIDDRDAGLTELADGTLLLNWFTSTEFADWSERIQTASWGTEEEKIRGKKYLELWRTMSPEKVKLMLGCWTRRSTDGGRTWETPVRQAGTRPHNVLGLRDGRVLAIGMVYDRPGLRSPLGEVPIVEGPACEVSEDGGKNWRELARVPVPADVDQHHLHEPHALELSDGRIIALYRYQKQPKSGYSHAGESWQTESSDGGRTWSTLHRTGIHGYPPHLIQLRDGRVLCAYAKRLPGVRGIYAVLSADGARTWDVAHETLLVDSGANDPSDFGYPSSVQMPDGSIFTAYYHPEKVGEKPVVMAVRWRLPTETPTRCEPVQVARRPWVVLNEDGGCYLDFVGRTHPGARVTPEMVAEYCDPFLVGPVTHYFVNPGGMSLSYDSSAMEWCVRTHDLIGNCALNGKEHLRNVEMLRQMNEDGVDPYAAMMARARAKGVSPWLSMRMNDIHHINEPDNCALARFWKNHPEYRIDPAAPIGTNNTCYGRNLGFDYAHAAVRERHLNGLKEMLSRYDIDGVELDWMRHPYYFRVGHEREDAHFLTEFMREAKELVTAESARKGRALQVAVRIPSRPVVAKSLGIDFDDWAKEGLLDVLIPSDDYLTADYGFSVKDWRPLLAGSPKPIRILPGCDVGIAPECSWSHRRFYTFPEQAGWIERHLADGADGLYYFNMEYVPRTHPSAKYFVLDSWSRERFAALPRDYPVSFCDCTQDPELKGIPFGGTGKKCLDIPVLCGTCPEKGTVAVLLAFSRVPRQTTQESVRLNDVSPSAISVAPVDSFIGTPKGRHGNGVVRFEFPLSALKSGPNMVSVLGDGKSDCWLHACRIEVRPVEF